MVWPGTIHGLGDILWSGLGQFMVATSVYAMEMTVSCADIRREVTTQLKANNREKAGRLLATALLFAAGSGTIILLLMKASPSCSHSWGAHVSPPLSIQSTCICGDC